MKNTLLAIGSAAVVALGIAVAACTTADNSITMSTTTSTQASGLLDVLLPELEKDTGIRVKVVAKGTGAAIRDGRDGNVDVIFVHDRDREQAFVKEGYGTRRHAVMHNDFVILGPPSDPARIRGGTDAAVALAAIAGKKALFVSRGDDSGTHAKEQELWKRSGVRLEEKTAPVAREGKKAGIRYLRPLGSWYRSLGQGMGKTLTFADEKGAYALSDRGTYIKYKYGRKGGIDLEVLCEGDRSMLNPYGAIPVSPKKHPHVKNRLAVKFAGWLISSRGQAAIANYRLLGKQLFYPDAIPGP